jgi:hypothetical protein
LVFEIACKVGEIIFEVAELEVVDCHLFIISFDCAIWD